MQRVILTSSLALVLALGSAASADPQKPTFDADIVAIFKQHCTNCHGNDKQKSDLNIATFAALQKGGSSGSVVTPGDPGKSRLFTLTAHTEEPKMPPSGSRIPEAQLNLLKLWIEQGARENAGSKTVATVMPKTEIGLKSVVKGRPEGPPPMPAIGALPLDPIVRARRPGAVLALATSPWAPLIAIGGQKQVILYNSDNSQLIGILPFEHGQIHSIKFSRNAQFILVAGGRGGQAGKAALYKVATGEKIVEVGIESDAILAADISADQSQIAVGSSSKLVRVYSTVDGSVVREIKKHTDWVTAVEFSPDGVLLATGDRNGGLFVWEAFTGREYFTLRGHTAMITDLSWRDDSNVLASSSEDSTIKLWEMENGNNIKSWSAHAGGAASVRYSHDNRLVSTGRDKLTKIWDQNGAVQKQFEAFPDLGLRVSFSHDNARVIAGDWSGVVKAWTSADAKLVAALDANPPPTAERLKVAEAALAASETKLKLTQVAFETANTKAKLANDALAAAQAKLAKVNAELAAATKLLADQMNVAKAVKPALDALKAEVDKLGAAAMGASFQLNSAEVVYAAESEAAKKIQEAAAKAPNNPNLVAAAKKATETITALAKEIEALRKIAKETDASTKAASDKYLAMMKQYTDSTAQAGNAQKQVESLTQMVKPATDAIAPLKAAFDAANAAIPPLKVANDAAAAELAAAKMALELTRVSATPQPAPKK